MRRSQFLPDNLRKKRQSRFKNPTGRYLEQLEERALLAAVTVEDLAVDFAPASIEGMPWATVADYRDDYSGTPATGWSYLWNQNGPIGTAANYGPLLYNGSYWDSNGVNNALPDGTPLQWGHLTSTGGHAGTGNTQGASGGIDRYVIAAYEIQANGSYRLANTLFQDTNAGCGDGADLRVYVNDTATKYLDLPNGHAVASFDHALGDLSAGDVIYVAAGPRANDSCDSIGLDFSVQRAVSVTGVTAASASGAAVTLNGDGTVHYDPTAAAALQATNAGTTTVDTITFTWNDGLGGSGTANGTVSVLGADEPVALTAETDEDRTIQIAAFPSAPNPIVVADYVDDFQGPTPAGGWNYMWNANGQIGNPANYDKLQWEGDLYDYDGIDGLPDANPAQYSSLNAAGGHPGLGSTQGGSGGFDRYVIASYEVPFDGYFRISNSNFNRGNGANSEADVLVHVNDDAPLVRTFNTAANKSFDTDLGFLSAGDIVYVASGPNGNHGNDTFSWDFSLEYVPYVAEAVADYRNDFQGPTPAAGWGYHWNATGAIGDPANYSSLLWHGSGYDFNGIAGLPDANPAAYTSFSANGGHPGSGFNQAGGGFDRFPIASYTVADDGVYEIADSFFDRGAGTGQTIQLVVHVNDNDPTIITYNNTANQSFDMLLGELAAGDTVYVGIGPNLTDGSDTFAWDFTIRKLEAIPTVSVPATSTMGAALSISSDGTISYDPSTSATLQALAKGASATDTFTYSLTDLNGRTEAGTASVIVTGQSEPYALVNDTVTTAENRPIDIDALANDGGPVVVADYQDDFRGPVALPGWSYMWNSLTPVGQPSGYADMLWDGARYDFNGVSGLPDANPLAWGNLAANGGHPGAGTANTAGGTDRAVIAAYTIAMPGFYRIGDSFFNRGAGAGSTVRLTVHVNDNAPVVNALNTVANQSFDTDLGYLNAGDTVYVALGPNTADGSDSFTWDYSIEFVPNPSFPVAGYQADFQGTAPAADWQYVWNANGPVGDPANYASLNWNGSSYDFNGMAGVPDADPLAWGNLTSSGGHPGRGANQLTGGIDRFVLAGYTVPTDGVYELTDTFFNRPNANNGAVQLIVHVNDNPPAVIDYAVSANRSFDVLLGELSAGDTIYVGLGPNLTDGSDTFTWDFTVTRRQDPPLIASVGSTAEGAAVSVNADGTIHYDTGSSATLAALNPGQMLNDTFTYTIQDPYGRTATATVTVTVEGTPNALSASPDTAATNEDTAVDIDAVANDPASFIVADYADDFQGPVATPGWSYLWNSLTPIGQPAGYAPLNWTGSDYDFNGTAGTPDLDPLAWGLLTGTGGHPGRGTNDGNSAGGFDRGVIAAYTVPQSGNYQIVNSTFGDTDGGLNNLALTVHVGTAAPVLTSINDSNGKPFDVALGHLNAGDTIYVALGPNTDDGGDGFAWDFSIQFDSAPEVIAAGTSTLGAAVSVNPDGSIHYDPSGAAAQALAAGETAVDTFSYTVTDPDGRTATSTVSVTVTGANDAPAAVADPNAAANEDDASVTIDVLANDSDPDIDANAPNDSITVSAVTQGTNGGTVTVGPGGVNVSYSPNGQFEYLAAAETAIDTFTYTMADQSGATSTATVTVTITGQNDAPLANAGGPYTLNEGASLTLDASASVDPDTNDNPGLTYSWDINGDGTFGDAVGQTPTISWAALQALGIDDDAAAGNPWNVAVQVSDALVTAASATTTLTLSNAPPTAAITGAGSAVPGFEVSYTLSATDPSTADQNGQFTYVVDWQDGTTDTFTGASPLTVTHNFQNFGLFQVSVTATDKDGGVSAPATVTVDVVPVAVIGNDIYAGGSSGPDRIIFFSSNGGIRVRFNNVTYPTDGSSFALGAGGKMLAFGQGGGDHIVVASPIPAPAMFDGGDANDYLAGGLSNDTLLGGDGNDTLLAGEGNNFVDGGVGNDRLEGRNGADSLFGGDGADRLNGGAGDDILDGGAGSDFLFGDLGNDLLVGRSGIDTLNGHAGNDILAGGADADQIFGGIDNDLLIGGTGADRLRGDAGDDAVLGNSTALDAALETALDDLMAAQTPLPPAITAALNAWFSSQSRPSFGALTEDGDLDDLTGGTGADEFHSASDRIRDQRAEDSVTP